MKVVFFGSTSVSVEILKELIDKKIIPHLIVTQPAKPAGRGLKICFTEVKLFSERNNLNVITPRDLSEERFISYIKELLPDIYIVIDYGRVLPVSLLTIPKIIPIGIHFSLLPKYRGPAPVNWCLIRGEKETGVTIFKINSSVDRGEIILQERTLIEEDDDVLSLSNRLTYIAKKLIIKTIFLIEKGKIKLLPQNEREATYFPKIDKKMCRIDWNRSAYELKNLVRGLLPYPCAWTIFRGKRLKILKAYDEIDSFKNRENGEIVYIGRDCLKVVTQEGLLRIEKVQPQDKKVMEIRDFINGYHPKLGEKFC